MHQTSLQYDGTFDGFLSMIFYAFEHKLQPQEIFQEEQAVHDLFSEIVRVETDITKAERVWKGLIKKTSQKNARMIHVAFMSEVKGVEMLLWCYFKKIFTTHHENYFQNMLDEDIHSVVQIARKVYKEAHRFMGFVRFQETTDGMLFASVDPDHDILKLIAGHFKRRYSDQKWVIYDTRRRYGIYWDLQELNEIILENPEVDFNTGQISEKAKQFNEDHYQQLWQSYYDSVNISQRSNKKQMTRLMPRRYWKYLPEKNKKNNTKNP
jgi:probable DNA metabolism protein